MVIRSGSEPSGSWPWKFDPWNESGAIRTGTHVVNSTFALDSQYVPHWRDLLGKADVGSGFSISKTKWDVSGVLVLNETSTRPGHEDRLDGPVYYPGNSNTESSWSYSTPTTSQMNAWGTTAIARTSPTNPAFDLATFLGEVTREGMPQVPTMESVRSFVTHYQRSKALRSRKALGKAGGEYLNVEFGWNPLVSSLRSFAETVVSADEVLQQYRRDSGRQIRRRYAFPVQTASYAKLDDWHPGLANYSNYAINGVSGQCRTWRNKSQEVWFSGAFMYHVPLGPSQTDKFNRFRSEADKLLGLSLTPDTVWNLAPWSWAIDWFSNTGDVMRNISNIGLDGLVLKYGYVMANTTTTHTYHTRVLRPGSRWYWSHLTKEISDKRRSPATPYGFGLSTGDLTTRQKAILVALGLSKSG